MAPLALTMGEPSGVAAEITAATWRALRQEPDCRFFVIAHPSIFDATGVASRIIDRPEHCAAVFADYLPVLDLGCPIDAVLGAPSPANAKAVISSIDQAVALTMGGRASGVVTNPVQKSTLMTAGFSYAGHTDYLAALASKLAAEKAEPPTPVMMLAGPQLRAAPATVHQPLKVALSSLNTEALVEIGVIVAQALRRDFGLSRARLAYSGVNPHAGEGGALGTEDAEVIAPAVARLNAQGVDAIGPLPADTMFHEAARATYDAAICMYHDQALIPVKTLDFYQTVNVTLGLPFVRTSPDHGTALDIAGKGLARPDSLIAAVRLAGEMARRRAS